MALECQRIFFENVRKNNQIDLISSTQVFQDSYYRFNAWTSYLGVFAPVSTSLDSRLKDAVDVKDLVIRMLHLILYYLQLFSRSLQYQNGVSMSDQATATSSSSGLPEHSQIEYAIERSIDRLERLGVAIRQSSTAGLQQRVEVFAKKKANASFEELSLKIVQSMYPDADEDLQSYLGRSIFMRYVKLRYKHEHQKKLATHRPGIIEDDLADDESSAPALEPATGKVGTRPDEPSYVVPYQTPNNAEANEKMAGPLLSDTIPSVFKGEIETPREPSQKTTSIIVRGATYPKPPKEESAPNLKTCDWCFEIYQTTQFEDQKWWVRHVDRDLLPYVCLSEDCMESMVQFERYECWKKHMEVKHSPDWAENVYARKWFCDIDHSSHFNFNSFKSLKDHMYEHHTDLLDDTQIDILAENSSFQTRRDPGICPLCCFSVAECDQIVNENQDSEDDKLSTNTTESRQSGKEKVVRLEHRTPPKKVVKFDISSQDSQNTASSSADDVSSDPTTILRGQSDKSIQKKVAMHIAKHLQTLCLFSLRLKTLDEQECSNFEGQEYESQSTMSTISSLEYSSREEDMKDGEILVFDEISSSLTRERLSMVGQVSWQPGTFFDEIGYLPNESLTRSCSEMATDTSSLPDRMLTVDDIPSYTGTGRVAADVTETRGGVSDSDSVTSGTWDNEPELRYRSSLHIPNYDPPLDQSQTDDPNTDQAMFKEGGDQGVWDVLSWLNHV